MNTNSSCCRPVPALRQAGVLIRPAAAAVLLLLSAAPVRAIVDGAGQDIFPATVTMNSSATILGGGGLLVTYGITAASVTLTGGITASSGTFTQTGAALYSLQTSSGINVLAGGVTAPFFAGDGSGLFKISSVAVNAIHTNAIQNNAVAFSKIGINGCTGSQIIKMNAGGTAWECAEDGGAGSGVVLAPAAPQTDASANDSISVNDTAGGNLLKLQQGGADKFVVDNTGTLTFAGGSAINALGALTINTDPTGALSVDSGGSGAVNIGSGANTKAITLGNSTGSTALTLNSGSGNIDIGASAVGRSINIGTGAGVVENINIGGTGANVIAVGNTQTAGSISLGAAMTGGTITMGGTGLQTGTIGIGIGTGAQTLNLGTGGTGIKTINIGGAAANAIAIGNTQTAGSIALGAAMTGGAITIGGTGLHTGAIGIGTGAGAQAINLGTGGTGIKTISIGGTAANVIGVGDVQVSGSISLGAAMTDGAVNIGGTGAQTGAIDIGSGTGAQAINFGTGIGAKTIAIGGIGDNVIGLGNAQPAGSVSLGAAMTVGTINIGGTGAQTGAISIGAGTGVQTLNFGTGGIGAKIINIGTGDIGNAITIGNNTAATALELKTGSGGLTVNDNQMFVAQNTGNVGIGLADPAALLQVASAAYSGSVVFQVGGGTLTALGNGNVGIGTASPDSRLSVSGGNLTLGALDGTSAAEMRFMEGSANGTKYVSLKSSADLTNSITFVLPAADGTLGQILQTDGSGNLGWSANSATGMSNPMTVTGDLIYGNTTGAPSTPASLPIGTPGQCLTVSGGLPVWGACSGSSVAAGLNTQLQFNDAGSFGASGNLAWDNVNYTLSSTGTIAGVKTSLALRNAHGGTTATNELIMGNNVSTDTLALWVNGGNFTGAGNSAYIYNRQNAPLTLGTNNMARLTVLPNGNVGIGTAIPDAALEVDGNIKACSGGACPAITGQSGTGDLIVQNEAYFSGDKIVYPADAGWTRPKRSIILTAGGAITPTSGGAAQAKVDGANHSYYVLNHDADTAEAAFWQWTMPDSYDGGTIDITYYWTAGVNSGNVVWCFNAGGVAAGGAVDSALSADVCDTAAAPGTAGYLAATAHPGASSNFTAGKYTIFRIFRNAADGADTMAGDASLLNVKIEYGVSAESD